VPTPLSIRFESGLLARFAATCRGRGGREYLGAGAAAHQWLSTRASGIVFKSGSSGRRAALAYGPDVWEVVTFLREIDERGPSVLAAAAEVFALDVHRISAAVSYYGEHRDEIDAEVDAADEASARAERAWQVRQQLIS
jgi:hypothetical protein